MMGITILGATGTIGLNTLAVLRRYRRRFRVAALTANQDVEGLYQQCMEWQPSYAVMADADAAERLRRRIQAVGSDTEVLAGIAGLQQVAALPEVKTVMAAIVGAAGLLPTLAAVQAGKRVLLANKEALVMSGQVFMQAVRDHHSQLLPIDSEHNAVFQCLPIDYNGNLETSGAQRIVLTASGGPFRKYALEKLATVTPEQACAHPNWVMGRKISVDSATMMNKGLEVIEACWLFNTSPAHIEVVIHPQSIIHSLVEYRDGSMLAQLSNPDMRVPIAHALTWPERIESGVSSLDLTRIGQLNFESVDNSRFPCLRLAYEAMRRGGTATTILNAANEIAVEAFLANRIRFTDIAAVIEAALTTVSSRAADDLETIAADDAQARQAAAEAVSKYEI